MLALKFFFSLRSCSTVSYAYYKPLRACQKSCFVRFLSQKNCQCLTLLQPTLCLCGPKASLEACTTTPHASLLCLPAQCSSELKKKVLVFAQMNQEQLTSLRKDFDHNQKTEESDQKEQSSKQAALECVVQALQTGVL